MKIKYPYTKPQSPIPFNSNSHPSHFCTKLWSKTLCQGHDTPLGHGQQLREILSDPWPGHGFFWYARTVTLTLETRPCVKVVTHPWVTENNCVKYYPDSTLQFWLWPGHRSWVSVYCDLDLGDMTLGQGHCTSFGHGKHLCEILS